VKEIQTIRVLPPHHVSRAASNFVSQLLEHEPAKRLGSTYDSDITDALFFEGIDWEATTANRSAPAFVPGLVNISKGESERALNEYRSPPTNEEGGRFLSFGLMAVSHPPTEAVCL